MLQVYSSGIQRTDSFLKTSFFISMKIKKIKLATVLRMIDSLSHNSLFQHPSYSALYLALPSPGKEFEAAILTKPLDSSKSDGK